MACSFREKLRLNGRESSPGLPPPSVLTVGAAIDVSASEVSAPPYGRQLPKPQHKEGTMCYSKAWLTEDERRQREAKAKEAEAKRADTVKTMLADAEKQASEAAKVRERAPAK
jgi:hypothetical protein